MTDPNGLLDMHARYYNPFLCRFISSDPSGFKGGLNFYAFANGNPVSFVDPFGLGALSDALAATSWFNAPTPEDLQLQDALACFVNLATLGVANLASSATTGKDLTGNNLSFEDAYQQTMQMGTFVASLALALPTDGASVEIEEAVTGTPNIVYRALSDADADAVAAGQGLTAKAPNGTWTAAEHVANSGPGVGGAGANSPWRSTTSRLEVAQAYNSGNGVVAIDLNRVTSLQTQVWRYAPRVNGVQGLPFVRSFWAQETTIFQSIPAEAIMGFVQ
jgi:hypothetical protein